MMSIFVSSPRIITSVNIGIEIIVAMVMGVFNDFFILYMLFMFNMLHKPYVIARVSMIYFALQT